MAGVAKNPDCRCSRPVILRAKQLSQKRLFSLVQPPAHPECLEQMVLITFITIIQRCHPCSELRQNITSITTSKFTAGSLTSSELRLVTDIPQPRDPCPCHR